MVCLLTAAKRPAISTRKMRQSPPSATAHNYPNPNRAPACADVVIDPISRNPATLVTIPSARLRIFFMPPYP
jgi:hypothetical protein